MALLRRRYAMLLPLLIIRGALSEQAGRWTPELQAASSQRRPYLLDGRTPKGGAHCVAIGGLAAVSQFSHLFSSLRHTRSACYIILVRVQYLVSFVVSNR